MSLVQEFKEFAVKGNAVDMAVGIIIGAAFGKIVSSLVNDVIMPPIGLLTGGVDFSKLAIVFRAPVEANAAAGIAADPGCSLRYGMFINSVVDFVIVAFCIFMMVKVMNVLRRSETEPAKK